MNTPSKNQGFTLIELIVVIVILGVMAAVAGPKFVNLQSDARTSVISGIEGSVRSAATLVYSKSLINGTESAATSTVDVQGATVDTVFGYPAATAAGIVASVDLTGATDIDGTTTPGTFTYTGRTDCQIVYAAAASANAAPTITPTTTGC